MKRLLLVLAVVVLGVASLAAGQEDDAKPTLGLGDAAPKLGLKEFVKGEAVKQLDKGTIYVLEFWATWCGPCVRAIPHVTELQKKHPGVVFIGVNVWENDVSKVKPFVEKMGEKMNYRVALDDVKDKEGHMAKEWLAAAGQTGIPCSIIIDGQGRIAWIGHPMEMDKPLAKVVAGTWDIAVAKAEMQKAKELQAKMRELSRKYGQAKTDEDKLKVLDEAMAAEPELAERLSMAKFMLLSNLNRVDDAIEMGRKVMAEAKDSQALNHMAWLIVDPDRKTKPDAKFSRFALEVGKKADELAEKKDAAIADTLARCYFVVGETENAFITQQRAVTLAKGTEMEAELKERLEEYRKANKKN